MPAPVRGREPRSCGRRTGTTRTARRCARGRPRGVDLRSHQAGRSPAGCPAAAPPHRAAPARTPRQRSHPGRAPACRAMPPGVADGRRRSAGRDQVRRRARPWWDVPRRRPGRADRAARHPPRHGRTGRPTPALPAGAPASSRTGAEAARDAQRHLKRPSPPPSPPRRCWWTTACVDGLWAPRVAPARADSPPNPTWLRARHPPHLPRRDRRVGGGQPDMDAVLRAMTAPMSGSAAEAGRGRSIRRVGGRRGRPGWPASRCTRPAPRRRRGRPGGRGGGRCGRRRGTTRARRRPPGPGSGSRRCPT